MQKKISINHKGVNRRNFLKRFALISTFPFGAASACCKAVYGPRPYTGTIVTSMHYLHPDNFKALLYEAKSVAADSRFSIQFSDPMQESSQEAVLLKNVRNRQVPVSFQWDMTFTLLKVTPETRLQSNTDYTLLVTEKALDAEGTPIQLTGTARATFTTVAS